MKLNNENEFILISIKSLDAILTGKDESSLKIHNVFNKIIKIGDQYCDH